MKATVAAAWKEAVSYGTLTDQPFLDVSLMFGRVRGNAGLPDTQRDKLLSLPEAHEPAAASRGELGPAPAR
jgi:hypothetical protein